MASEGPNSPGTLADDSSIGTLIWSSPSNAGASDDSWASAGFAGPETTHYLKATNFGFSVSGTIVGIEVNWEVSQTASGIGDNAVRIVIGGTIGSTDRSSGVTWPSSDTVRTYGGPADLWGETPSDSDINGSGFGAAISATGVSIGAARIDHVTIVVYYTSGSPLGYDACFARIDDQVHVDPVAVPYLQRVGQLFSQTRRVPVMCL